MSARCFLSMLVVLSSVYSGGQSSVRAKASSARLISIPVSVTDQHGKAISGMGLTNFAVSIDGKKVDLEQVTEVAPVLLGKAKSKVAFIVLDAIGNTSNAQEEARKECLQLLAYTAEHGDPISLSEIDREGLKAVHEIGTPDSVLASALLQLDTEDRFLSHRDQLQAMGASGEDKSRVPEEAERLRQFRHGSIQSANMMGTIMTQLTAFQAMANALKGANGRKTVIWLTGYFPIEINEVEDSVNINSYGVTGPFPVKPASIDYQRTIDLLNEAEISVFPVQLDGSQRTTIGLNEFAKSTSGEVMSSSQELVSLMKRAQDRTSSYYMVRFHPMPVAKLRWMKVKVSLNGQSDRVVYRKGVFLFPPVN